MIRLLLCVGLLTFGGSLVADWQRPGPPASFIAILGHWESATEAGIPVLTADARRWDGKPPTDLAQIGTRLFGSSTPEFLANGAAAGAFPLAVFDDVPRFRTGTLSIGFKLIAGETDQIAGLAFDLKPTGDYLYVRYNTRDDNLALWRFVKGQREVIAHGTSHRRLALGSWHTLEVTLNGRMLTAVAAGDLRVEHQLERDVDGRVGAWTKRDSVTAFRQWRAR